eukprot:15315612-Alexandrium_andersonii.AAC.1
MSCYASQKSWVEADCQKQNRSSAVARIARKPAVASLETEIGAVFPKEMLVKCRFAPGDAAWSEEAFSLQFYFQDHGYTNVNVTHFGLPEVRAPLEGTTFY